MTKKYKKKNFNYIISPVVELVKENKIKLFILFSLAILSILTGIIVATKTSSNYNISDKFGVVDLSSNNISNSTFFLRLLSICLIFLILFACSFCKYLSPIAIIFLIYRSYLLGLNLTLMIIFYGISGVLVSIIIVLPCQILILSCLILFYTLLSKTMRDLRCFGGCKYPRQKSRIIFISAIILLGLCIFESLLLILFNAKIILVI